jgi:hypothetical protein
MSEAKLVRYFTLIDEGGLVVDVIDAEDESQALRIAREGGWEPIAIEPATVLIRGVHPQPESA